MTRKNRLGVYHLCAMNNLVHYLRYIPCVEKCVNLSGGSFLGNEPHPWVEKSPEADVRNIKCFILICFHIRPQPIHM